VRLCVCVSVCPGSRKIPPPPLSQSMRPSHFSPNFSWGSVQCEFISFWGWIYSKRNLTHCAWPTVRVCLDIHTDRHTHTNTLVCVYIFSHWNFHFSFCCCLPFSLFVLAWPALKLTDCNILYSFLWPDKEAAGGYSGYSAFCIVLRIPKRGGNGNGLATWEFSLLSGQ